jgi:hypothetical protein
MPPLTLAKALQNLAEEKEALAKREHELIAQLNAVLPQVGYRAVATGSDGQARGTGRLSAMGQNVSLGRKSLRCPHCDRRFAHALHLGRHVSAMHRDGVRHEEGKSGRGRSKVTAQRPKRAIKRRTARRRTSTRTTLGRKKKAA